jgi:hypothetical protein
MGNVNQFGSWDFGWIVLTRAVHFFVNSPFAGSRLMSDMAIFHQLTIGPNTLAGGET